MKIKNTVENTLKPLVFKNDSPDLNYQNKIPAGSIPDDLSGSSFTALIQSDRAFDRLLNTTLSRTLRALRNSGEIASFYEIDENGNIVGLKDLPKLSFSPFTAEADSCCVVAGDLQICRDSAPLKSLCLEKCDTEINRMAKAIGVAPQRSAIYAAYREMLMAQGASSDQLPTLEQFEQLSFIQQFIFLNMLTIINGVLEVEQNGNIIKRFNGLAELYSQPDVLTIDGSSGLLSSFEEILCRMDLFGLENFGGSFFMASKVGYTAIQHEVVQKQNGQYPAGWTVQETTETRNGTTFPVKRYFFNGLEIIPSNLLYIDDETMTGDILLVTDNVGVFSAVPLSMDARFLIDEWNSGNSPFVHWSEQAQAYPDCFTHCERLTNLGTVMTTEVNGLLKIVNIGNKCDVAMYQGLEGLVNINSYAPYIA